MLAMGLAFRCLILYGLVCNCFSIFSAPVVSRLRLASASATNLPAPVLVSEGIKLLVVGLSVLGASSRCTRAAALVVDRYFHFASRRMPETYSGSMLTSTSIHRTLTTCGTNNVDDNSVHIAQLSQRNRATCYAS